jgi:hypothetical protein
MGASKSPRPASALWIISFTWAKSGSVLSVCAGRLRPPAHLLLDERGDALHILGRQGCWLLHLPQAHCVVHEWALGGERVIRLSWGG